MNFKYDAKSGPLVVPVIPPDPWWSTGARKVKRAVRESLEWVAVIFLIAAMVVFSAAVVFAIPATLSLLLQFGYGWVAEGNGWRPMPFWVAFAIVVLVGVVTGRMRVKVKA